MTGGLKPAKASLRAKETMSDHSAAAELLGTEKIGKLLFQYSLPAIVAMTASSLYNIIDRIFIGHGVGPLAISGLALTLPLMNLAIAFGALVGAGAATLVSIRLGERRQDEALRILGNTVLLNLVLSSVVAAVMLLFLDRILYLFGASRETLPYAKQFMQIVLAGNVFMHSFMGLNNVMRASGYPRKAMVATLITVGLNVLLAPLFIFAFRWGIRGAALATVTVQIIGLGITIRHFSRRDSYVRFQTHHFTPDLRIIRDIVSMGMSNFIVNLCACLITIVLNLKLVTYGGDYAVGAFGIVNSILMCAVMIVLGLTQGMQPIAGYNYGARQFDRVRRVFHEAVVVATCITTLGFLAAELFPRQIALAFTGNARLVEISTDRRLPDRDIELFPGHRTPEDLDPADHVPPGDLPLARLVPSAAQFWTGRSLGGNTGIRLCRFLSGSRRLEESNTRVQGAGWRETRAP